MKKVGKISLSLMLGIASFLGTVSNTKAQTDTNIVSAKKENNVVTIGNGSLQREFSINENKLKTTKILNKWGNSEFVPQEDSQEFVVKTVATINERVEPTTLTSVKPTGGSQHWAISGTSVTSAEGSGYAGLIDGDLNTYYHSRYNNSGTGTKNQLPIDITIDRGENASATAFQTFGYRPRIEFESANGNIQKYELYVSDDQTNLYEASNLKKAGTFYYSGVYATERNPKFIYTSFAEAQTGRYVGMRVKSAVGGNRYAAGSEIDLYQEKFDSNTVTAATQLKTSDLTLANTEITDTQTVVNKVTKTGKMITFTFNPVQFGSGQTTIKEKVVMYDGDHFMRKFIEIDSTDKNIRFDYIDGEHFLLNESDKKWTIPTDHGGVVLMDAAKANLGQPIYVNGLFMGSEFPVADTQIKENTGHIRYYTGKNFNDFQRDNQLTTDGKYVSWQTVIGASHDDGTNNAVIQSDFFKYIYSISTPSEFRIQYNSWFDNMMSITDENILSSFSAVDKHFSETGVRPLDSYVVDDGWNLYRKAENELQSRDAKDKTGETGVNDQGFWMFNSKFPNQLTPSSQLVQNFGSNFGVWVGPRGGYNFYDDLAVIIENAGNGSKAGGSIDVADSRYVKKFEEMAIDWMKKYNVNYWKWDGFADTGQYNAFPSGDGVVGYDERHHHMYGGENQMYHVSDLWEKWIVLMSNVRVAAEKLHVPNLWISLTCYVNPSPWYLQWANSVWLQCVADRGERSNSVLNNKMDNMLSYRDGAYYDFIKNHQFQFPLLNIYNHDPIYGKEGSGIQADSMNGDQFRNYLFMQGTRGTAFWELYYSDTLFNEEKYLVNADFLSWIETNFNKIRNAKMIGGTPSSTATLSAGVNGQGGTQETYGFAGFEQNAGIISMRNPSTTAKSLTIRLDEAIGVKAEGTYHTSLVHSYSPTASTAKLNKTYQKGDEVTITLQPGEVQIWNFDQEKDVTAPKLTQIYTKNSTTIQVKADEHLYKDPTFVVKRNGTAVSATPTKFADLRTFNLTLEQPLADNDQIEVTVTTATDASDNQINSTISKKYYDNDVVAYQSAVEQTQAISPAERSIEGTNGFSVSAVYGQQPTEKTALVKQGDSYELGIDAEAHPYFKLQNTTVTSNKVVGNQPVLITGVKENNGLIKIYIDGKVSKAAYEAGNKDFNIPAHEIVAAANTQNVQINSKSLGYDEVPQTALKMLMDKVAYERSLYTAESWAEVSIDDVLTTAQAALDNATQTQEMYDLLLESYKHLVPTTQFNIAYQKPITVNWLDENETAPNTRDYAPTSYIVDGETGNASNHGIFGQDEKAKPSYITIDLQEDSLIDGVKLYRYWLDNRTYNATAVVISKDADFANKEILYYSNSDKNQDIFKLGVKPTNDLYQETAEGKDLVSLQTPKEARYVRLYANGVQNGGVENHIVELLISGTPKSYDPYNIQELELSISQIEPFLESDAYTTDSKDALRAQIEKAKAVVAAVKAHEQEDKTIGYVLGAKEELYQKYTELVLKEEQNQPEEPEVPEVTTPNVETPEATNPNNEEANDADKIVFVDEATKVKVEGTKESLDKVVGMKVGSELEIVRDGYVGKHYDITLLDADGNAIQPTSDVTVTLPYTAIDANNVEVKHYLNGEYKDVKSYNYENNEAHFVTDHFSIYYVGEKQTSQPSSEQSQKETPKDANNKEMKNKVSTGQETLTSNFIFMIIAAVGVFMVFRKRDAK